MSDTIAILPAGWRDLAGVRALEHVCFAHDAWGPLELFISLVSRNVRLKAVVDGRLVGFIIGEDHPFESCAWIVTLGVHPDYQRRGLGARLLAETEARLAEPRVRLTVRPSNTPAIALYRKFGYEPAETLARYYAGGEDGMVMEKRKPALAGRPPG